MPLSKMGKNGSKAGPKQVLKKQIKSCPFTPLEGKKKKSQYPDWIIRTETGPKDHFGRLLGINSPN